VTSYVPGSSKTGSGCCDGGLQLEFITVGGGDALVLVVDVAVPLVLVVEGVVEGVVGGVVEGVVEVPVPCPGDVPVLPWVGAEVVLVDLLPHPARQATRPAARVSTIATRASWVRR
jgi:hypothetical protein